MSFMVYLHIFFLLFFCGGIYLAVLRGYSSLCTQESLLVGLEDYVECWGMAGYMEGKNPTHCAISLASDKKDYLYNTVLLIRIKLKVVRDY